MTLDVDQVAGQAVGPLRGLQHRAELAGLLSLIADVQPAVIVEIGTRTGASLWAFAQAAPDAALVSIDPTNEGRFLDELIGRDRELHLIAARSQELSTLIQLERILDGRPIGFLFIDGDHTLEAVERDFAMYSPLVDRDLGFVALHDVRTIRPEVRCEVHLFWAQLRERYPDAWEIVDEQGSPAYGIGIVPGMALAPASPSDVLEAVGRAHASWARRRYKPGHPLHPDTEP